MQLIVPSRLINKEHNVEIFRGICPTTVSPLQTAMPYLSSTLPTSRTHCKLTLTSNSIPNSSKDVIPSNHAIGDKLVMGHGQANAKRLACIKIFIYIFEALNKYTMLKLRMVWCFNEHESLLPLKISRIQYTITLVPTVILDNIY